MWTDAQRIAALLALATLLACERGPAPETRRDDARGAASTVALLTDGSAFAGTNARGQVALLVGAAAGRPVSPLAAEPTLERVLAPVAKRVARETGGAARANVREPACRKKGRPVATALAAHADLVYRVRLDAKTTTRAATDADREDLGRKGGLGGMLAGVVGGRPDTVFETRLDGAIERTTFAGAPATSRQPIRWIVRALGRKGTPPPLDVREAVSTALARMDPPPAPRWDALARSFVNGGCPLLGYAVADAFVDDPIVDDDRDAAGARGGVESKDDNEARTS